MWLTNGKKNVERNIIGKRGNNYKNRENYSIIKIKRNENYLQ